MGSYQCEHISIINKGKVKYDSSCGSKAREYFNEEGGVVAFYICGYV